MKRAKLIEMMEVARVSHQQWAEYFEKHPDMEKEYVASGEWDSAKVHREYEAAYLEVIRILRGV